MSPQNEAVLNYMRTHNGISTFAAFEKLRITRLSARIKELRDIEGFKIVSEKKFSKGNKPYVLYRLKEGDDR